MRRSWAEYYNALSALDRKVGAVLDLLEADGLADSTVVVFLGDHGRAMPRGKQWCYDSGLRIPMIVREPGGPGGTVRKDLIEAIDLAAQTLAWAGLSPEGLHGRPFDGPPRRYARGGRDRGDETVDRVRTLRDSRFRYVRNYFPERPWTQLNRYKRRSYPIVPLMTRLHAEGKLTGPAAAWMAESRPREELYDTAADPDEVTNLAADPAYRGHLLRMRSDLEAWLAEVGDEARFPEDPDAIEAAEMLARRQTAKHAKNKAAH